MAEQTVTIRTAAVSDAAQLLEIYRPYVEHTAITFEYDVPTVEEFKQRIADTLQKYPYLVAEDNGEIAGYAYASVFKNRAAYDWAVETSVYVKQGLRGNGYGKKLYLSLEELLRQQNILNLNACIACTECEDAHLTNDSMQFHEHLGYKPVGTFHKCGYKFGTWYDMIWMEKMLGPHLETPEPVILFEELRENQK